GITSDQTCGELDLTAAQEAQSFGPFAYTLVIQVDRSGAFVRIHFVAGSARVVNQASGGAAELGTVAVGSAISPCPGLGLDASSLKRRGRASTDDRADDRRHQRDHRREPFHVTTLAPRFNTAPVSITDSRSLLLVAWVRYG